MGGAANSRLAARVLSGAEDEGVGVGVGGLVGEIEGEAGGVLGEGELACADEVHALDGLGQG